MGSSYHYPVLLNGGGAGLKPDALLMAGVRVDDGGNHVKVWQTKMSYGLTVPLLFLKWFGLVAMFSSQRFKLISHCTREMK